jgi:hypothetical protein
MAVANTQAYYFTATITAVKRFIVQAPGLPPSFANGIFAAVFSISILAPILHRKIKQLWKEAP